MSDPGHRYRTINGQMANQERIVGYCRLHKRHLTEPQLIQRECVQKGCRWLKRWDCQFWDRKNRMKEVRQLKKEQGIPSWERIEVRTDREGKLLKVQKKGLNDADK